jgi:hypothetical protein
MRTFDVVRVRVRVRGLAVVVAPAMALALALTGCGQAPAAGDGGNVPLGDGGTGGADGALDGARPGEVDGGYLLPDGAVIAADRFVTGVVSFTPGDCAGFGVSAMPQVVEGPPIGGGATQGSTDVVSLGVGGSIVLSFAPNAIVDGPGVDFVVFENAFFIGGNPNDVFAEPAEVSVSDDGTTWTAFPCTTTQAPFGACAGWHPVLSAPGDGVSPVDWPACGGDGFDLADVGLTHARFVRIRDMGGETCPVDPSKKTNNMGFDLDALALINSAAP